MANSHTTTTYSNFGDFPPGFDRATDLEVGRPDENRDFVPKSFGDAPTISVYLHTSERSGGVVSPESL